MHNLKLVKVTNPEEDAENVFRIIKEELENNRLQVIGLATGSTMIPVYNKLTESELDFTNVTTFNLDEYVGIPATSKNGYAFFMNQHLFSKKQFNKTYIP